MGKKARRKKAPSVAVHCCVRNPMGGSYLVVFGRRSLRFFRNAMIGFPQRSQNENSGKPIPATTASLSCLISFLQLSHLRNVYSGKIEPSI